jgi:predicted HicB family RNase H-like nuclease
MNLYDQLYSALESYDKKARGGKRPGSGRKKRNTVQLTIRLSREANERLRAQATAAGLSVSELVESFISPQSV